jgi:hypothetical protein
MRTVWAYTSRATGTYQSASPSLSAPTAVTVAGKAYAIETSEAAFDLSNLGGFRTGDTVTLLLGRSGGVAAVVRAGQISSVVYGAVSSLGTASYTDSSGNAYTASAVTLTATDGSEYTFRTSLTSLKPGDLVQVTSSSSGETVTRLSEKALTGKMSSDGAKLGAYVLAGDAEILDTAGNLALRVYPARLAGISFTSGMVRYYVLNSAGQVSRLILDDVTGDLYSYGVITSASEISSGTTTVGSYVYDIGGMTGSYASSSSSLGVSAGPCRFVLSGGTLSSATNLKSVRLTGLDGNIGLAGSASYTLADDVAVYEVQRGDYYLSSLDRVGSGFSLTGWYDKAESSGGRVRVILAMASAD